MENIASKNNTTKALDTSIWMCTKRRVQMPA